ncbi:MAG TPA: hypothetical protein VKE93_09745 [Candidatus Angelobacter sp.]|nr:hypothetical protein [Candidatus Angelobacter sp.]
MSIGQLARALENPQPPQYRKGFSFRLALPLGQLVLCAVILLPIRGYIFYELGLTRLAEPALPFQFGSSLLRPFVEWSQHNGLDSVAALNLPAGLVQLPYDIFSRKHVEFTPGAVSFRVWRAVTWPVLGTVFWWSAGRGAEAFVGALNGSLAPRLRWIETVLACTIVAVCGTITVMFPFMDDVRGDGTLIIFAAGSAVWTFLGGLTVTARILQRRIRKKLRTSPPI